VGDGADLGFAGQAAGRTAEGWNGVT